MATTRDPLTEKHMPHGDTLDGVFLRVRPASMAAQCCGTRLYQLVSPMWQDRGPLLHKLPGLFLISDIAQIVMLRGDDRIHLPIRLAVDAAQIGIAGLTAIRDDYDESAMRTFPGCALAIEAGARLGPAGLVVPLANGVVFVATRHLRGHQPRPMLMGWQVAAAVGGMGLARYGRRRRAAELERHRREIAARLQRAELEGRADLTNGVDALIDEVQRVGVLIDLAADRRTGNRAGDWKARLGQEVRRDFAFVGDVLARHQSLSNTVSDLRAMLVLQVDEAAGTAVLSADQAAELTTSLERLALRGRHRVDVSADRRTVVVTVVSLDDPARGSVSIPLRSASRPLRLDFDPVPGGFAWSALWLAVAGGRTRENVPRWASLGPAAAALGGMVMSHRRGVARGGRVSRPAAVSYSAAVSITASVLQTLTMRNQRGAHDVSRYPFNLAQRGFGMVALLARSELSRRWKWAAVGTAAFISAAGWTLTPRPRNGREFVAEHVWPVQSVMLAGAIAAGIDEDAALLAERIRVDDDDAIEQARLAGRENGVEFARKCLVDARETFERCAGELPPDLRRECERRLVACELRIGVVSGLGSGSERAAADVGHVA